MSIRIVYFNGLTSHAGTYRYDWSAPRGTEKTLSPLGEIVIDQLQLLAAYIKECDDDKFVFISTVESEESFIHWIKNCNLEENIIYRQKEFQWNLAHSIDRGPRLRLWVLGPLTNTWMKPEGYKL